MKHSLLSLIGLFVILSFSTSCGKKEGGSSGSKYNSAYNTGVYTNGVQAKNNLLAWYNSSTEGQLPYTNLYVIGVKMKYRVFSPGSNGCNDQPITVFGINLGNINVCSSNSNSGTTTYNDEYVTLLSSGNKATNNAELAAALAPVKTAGIVNGLQLQNVTQQGNVYTVSLIDTAGKSIVHVIDASYNSALNPVYTLDNVTGKETTFYQINFK